jgi:hypothetical protein
MPADLIPFRAFVRVRQVLHDDMNILDRCVKLCRQRVEFFLNDLLKLTPVQGSRSGVTLQIMEPRRGEASQHEQDDSRQSRLYPGEAVCHDDTFDKQDP